MVAYGTSSAELIHEPRCGRRPAAIWRGDQAPNSVWTFNALMCVVGAVLRSFVWVHESRLRPLSSRGDPSFSRYLGGVMGSILLLPSRASAPLDPYIR